jgi:cell division protein FtsW
MTSDAKIVFMLTVILVMVGVVMIYSSSAVYAFGQYEDSLYFVKKHLIFLFIGLGAAICCMAVPLSAIKDGSRMIMLATLILLVAVLIPGIGTVAGGARRWIRFLGFGFQPSEVAKIAIVLYLADFAGRKRANMSTLNKGFLPAFSVIAVSCGLILLEPDLGTTVAIGFVGTVMLFIAGIKLKYLMSLLLMAIPALALAICAAPYRLKRFTTFLKPWADPKGSGFQLIQSFIALGSGGFAGVGLGASRQKLFYLPQSHTDFIYSIIGEELGFIGTACVLIIFMLLIWFLFRLSFKIKETYASMAVLGISVIIAFEVIVNIGVSIGLVPTKGLPLPFISYGGSSLVLHLAAIGLVMNMARQCEA